MAFCTSCGSPLAEGALFCSNCGQRQNAAPAAPAYQAPVAEPVYEAPAAPVYEAPAAPAYEAPVAEPAYEAPAAEPTYEQPAYQAPTYEQPVYQAPVYQQPAYQQPTYQQYQPAPTSGGSNGKSIVSMILGIVALVFSLFDFIYTIMGFVALGTWNYYDDAGAGAVLLVFAILTLGCAIPGMILGDSSNSKGKLGKVFSIIGLAFGGLALLIGFICLA